MRSQCTPDLSSRPHSVSVEIALESSPEALYEAWTERFDLWFAQPGELFIKPEVDRPWFFHNRHGWGRHPHYGRFLELEKDRVVETTWVTGKGGTEGAETVVRVELSPQGEGTLLRLTHSGFPDDGMSAGHQQAWREGLKVLDECLKAGRLV